MVKRARRFGWTRLFWFVLLIVAGPAAADDISASSRGVVRILTFVFQDGEVVDMVQGSGFAVAPNKVVTNAHVVTAPDEFESAEVVVGVVPSEGTKPTAARILSVDRVRDLALLELKDPVEPVTLFSGAIQDGAHVIALGYPGNVERATSRSLSDYVSPKPPTRSEGNFSNLRQIDGVDALLHTAPVAHGSSGGPLLDSCGRVIGVNTFETAGDNGDSTFGFAISEPTVAAFLREAGQSFNAVSGPCVSLAERRAADEKAATERAEQDRQQRLADEEAKRHTEAMASEEREQARQQSFVLSLGLCIFGIAGLGAGAIFLAKDRTRPALIASLAGAAFVVGGVATFWKPPASPPSQAPTGPTPSATAESMAGFDGVCRIIDDRSRSVTAVDREVKLTWDKGGCVNGRTQYAEESGVLRRILVPHGSQTISVVEIEPARSEYRISRYFLSWEAMAALRNSAANAKKECSPDPAVRDQVKAEQGRLMQQLPPDPNERLVYKCDRSGG